MNIGGLQKLYLIEFPGYLSCVIFLRGCNFRCPFCHNPELVLSEKFVPLLDPSEVFEFLKRRKSYLEGVVITGGEPFCNENLIPFIEKVKGMGYAVKIDTNGSFLDKLRKIIKENLADYIAMDIKASPKRYNLLSGVHVDIEKIK